MNQFITTQIKEDMLVIAMMRLEKGKDGDTGVIYHAL